MSPLRTIRSLRPTFFAAAAFLVAGCAEPTAPAPAAPRLGVADQPVAHWMKAVSLTGAYDFDLEYAMDSSPGAAPASDAATAVSDRPGLFTALEEQLGLKLQPTRAPIAVTVIDRLTPPSAN